MGKRGNDELTAKQNDKTFKSKNKSTKITSIEDDVQIVRYNKQIEIREPTTEELKETENPDNIYSVKSCRTKKKEKYAMKLEKNKVHTVLEDKNRNNEYLKKWKKCRSEWKFEKLRQISIQLSIFDKDKIDDKLWPIALDYLSFSKGLSKNKLIELAEMEISKCDKEIEETEKDEITNNYKYRRARDILQSFD